MAAMENLEALFELHLKRKSEQATFDDCCLCGQQISSSFQLSHKGTDVCENCAKGVTQQEKDFIAKLYQE